MIISPAHNSRRRLLKMAAALPVTLPAFKVLGGDDASLLSFYKVENQPLDEGVKQGALVLVDSTINEFNGQGFYLYPDWGKPLVYEVRKIAGKLTFHYPGTDTVIWQLSADQRNARFSGRVEGVLNSSRASLMATLNSATILNVPAFPLT